MIPTNSIPWKRVLYAGGGVLIAGAIGTALWYFLWYQDASNKPNVGRATGTSGTTGGGNTQNEATFSRTAEDALNPNYVQEIESAGRSISQLSPAEATGYAMDIKNAFGDRWTWDDEDAIYAVFENELLDKVEVSQVAAAYDTTAVANASLLNDLETRLSSSEWNHVQSLIHQLPDYSLA